MMSEFPAEFSHIKPRSANGESADAFGSKRSPPVFNKAFSTEKMLKSSSLLSSKKSSQMQQQNCSSSSSEQLFHQQENRNFSRSVSVTSSSSSGLKLMSSAQQQQQQQMQQQRAYSVEEIDDDGNTVVTISGGSSSPPPPPQELRFEQKSSNSSSHSLLSADGYTAEKSAATNKELKRVQAGDLSYEEKRATSAMKAKLEGDGFCAEKMASAHQEQKQLKSGDTLQQQQRKAMTSSALKLSTDEFTAEKRAMSKQEERQMFSQGVMHQERNVTKSSKMAFSSSSSSTSTSSSINHKSLTCQNVSDRCMSTSPIGDQFALPSSTQRLAITQGVDEDLEILYLPSHPTDTEKAMARMRARMEKCVDSLKKATSDDEASSLLSAMNEMICRAWAVPTIGYDLGFSMCNILRNNGALDILIGNCSSESEDLQFRSAQVLEQCLSTENRTYVIERGLDRVVHAACSWRTRNSVSHSRVGIGILEHLFKHSEATCDEVVRMGGLETVLYECRTKDVETLRHCAAALANLSLYGGPENQKAMIKSKVPVWLFPLAFHFDDNIKYYACLAIAALVANKEIEAAVLRSGTLDLVEPFVSTHSPEEFARSTVAHVHGQSKSWLMKLVPVLNSTREEARSLAAFHFAMEAGIKKRQGNTAIFQEIGAVDALKAAASSPNAIASKYAAQALLLIGEQVPHKLSQQVPLWTVEDVREWVRQIGFSHYLQQFLNSQVDGDLLLQLDEEMLKEDINIQNGILRKRFLRELSILKRMTDYSSCDPSNVNQMLQQLGPEFSQYTYSMLRCGVDRDTLRFLTEDQLQKECAINNTIHKLRIGHAIRDLTPAYLEEGDSMASSKNLDVFVSYRRSNGSQLASLLKVHLQLRGFTVFIDVERLEAGKFDNNLLNSIQQAKHFLLVLTPNALDRCMGDTECKDWVHKEIVEALQSQCNIIPILDNFELPEPEMLPEDMRAVCYFNGVRWIHDYQDACVDKLERFMRGEMNVRSDGPLGRYVGMGGPGTPSTPSTSVSRAPVYQRSASNESAKGSNCSDKDAANGRVTEN